MRYNFYLKGVGGFDFIIIYNKIDIKLINYNRESFKVELFVYV